MQYSRDLLKKLYWMMKRIRLCEESLIQPIIEGEIRCPVHLYSGQEAIATGICAALARKDYLFGNHRSHGHYLAKGGDMTSMIAEIYGKESGCSRGRGGSMHLIDPENNVAGVTPIVAGTISLAVGAALATQIRGDDAVTVSFFGDGATGEGVLYEAMNFAALRKLPVIFICENNLYSTHLPVREVRVDKRIAEIARPFGIRTFFNNGNDVLKVYSLAKKSAELCRQGKGPVFLEFITYRLRGHVGPSDTIQGNHRDIRPKKEIEEWKRHDPIINFRRYLIDKGYLEEKELDKIDQECTREVSQANTFARLCKYPDPNEIANYVFSKQANNL